MSKAKTRDRNAPKPLSILFVASEIYPIAKTGGLADVAYGLPIALRDLEHDIRVMLPKYGAISERKNRIHEINRLKDIPVSVGERTELATVKSSSITNPRQKVQAYMTTNHHYYDSKWGLYADPETGADYEDNDERFIFFNKTVVQTCLLLGWIPNVVHVNDWQTALTAAYMRVMFPDKFKATKIVLTIHNIANQGEFPFKEAFAKTGLPAEVAENFKHKGKLNFLKAGMIYADHITTVSEGYAKEILADAKLSNGLNDILKKRKAVFTPILNGIDPLIWSPDKDKTIARRFTFADLDKKEDNKIDLVKKFGLQYNEATPVIAMISRLVEQKGFALLKEAAESLLKKDIQMVILGEGDKKIEQMLLSLMKKYPKKLSVKIGFDEILAHQIEAGADMFLMPSLFEPCGLNQMYSCVYGTIPIVHAVGGLADTIKEFSPKTAQGNGFTFVKFEAGAMLKAIDKALVTYQNKEQWMGLIKNAMSSDFTWSKSSKQYDGIYRALMATLDKTK